MKINNISLNARNGWIRKPFLAHSYHTWLVGGGSLTARLQQHYPVFSVKASVVKWARPFHQEASQLHLPGHVFTLVREVLLYGDQQPVVFAHSILPQNSLRGEWRRLNRLGNTPLGATLFANPRVRRTPLSFRKLTVHHDLYQAAVKHLQEKPAHLWARRSIFSLNGASIMVTEVFLPGLVKN